MPKLLITDDDLHLRKLVRTYAEVDGYNRSNYSFYNTYCCISY